MCIISLISYKVHCSQQTKTFSDLTLANIEALAQHGEESGEWKKGYASDRYPYWIARQITYIPCCKKTNDQYSACSAIDTCP